MCQRTAKPAQVQARLRGLVQHAYTNVPYYRDLMTGAGVHPSDFRTMRDFIDGFPPTHILHYRAVQHEEGPESLLDQRLRVENLSRDNSSGSTSVPVSVFHSPKEAAHYGAKTLSLLVRAGLRPWHRALAINRV
jgi:phenylacetate-coenzyme A ligase PaaK-like adenylate-forming protein